MPKMFHTSANIINSKIFRQYGWPINVQKENYLHGRDIYNIKHDVVHSSFPVNEKDHLVCQNLPTQILSWTRWSPTERWRSSPPESAGASGSPWSPTDPGVGTAVEGASPSLPPPWHPRRTTPQTGPTGWRRRPLPRRRTRSSPRGSTPRTWWEHCAAWSWPQADQSEVGMRAFRCDGMLYSIILQLILTWTPNSKSTHILLHSHTARRKTWFRSI